MITIMLLIFSALLLSGYLDKARSLRRLEDAIKIAQGATGFLYKLRPISTLYELTNGDKHRINFEGVTHDLYHAAEEGVYRQLFSDVEAINNLARYKRLANLNDDQLEEAVDIVTDHLELPLGDSGKLWELLNRNPRTRVG